MPYYVLLRSLEYGTERFELITSDSVADAQTAAAEAFPGYQAVYAAQVLHLLPA